MKQIKLKVGKTYKSRKGEEVEIVDFCEGFPYPYKGNRGLWYSADGRWTNRASPRDLVEEVIISDANQMKNLKLEVGKTYRNRIGEVRIVNKDNTDRYPYQGSDGEWYTENGRFDRCHEDPLHDLIEEVKEVPETCHAFITPDEAKKVTATRYTFAIPDGMTKLTVEQVSNRIIVEMVPEAGPKPGDIVFEDGRIMIVKKYPSLYHAMIHRNPDYLHINGSYGIPFTSATFRLATAEEAQLLLDALKKAGKRWNSETMEVEEVPGIDRILEWVKANKDYGIYSQEVAETIKEYLKYREESATPCSESRK